MVVFSLNCKKWTTFSVATVLTVLGIVLATVTNIVYKKVLQHELSLQSTKTEVYKMWKETPLPMYLTFHMFNWTNAEEYVKNPSIKPIFTECGPYTYYEHHLRENVTFNNNDTVTYFTKRTWRFEPDKSVGSPDDLIITLNPILAVMGKLIKYKHHIVKIFANFLLEEQRTKLYVKEPVGKLLFDGYEDRLLDLVIKLNLTVINLPFKKFGWFVDRNGSITYDGAFNMNTGADDIRKLGRIKAWNYNEHVPMWTGSCANVQGTSGELWYPPFDDATVKIFSPDLCSTIEMELEGDTEYLGVKGHRYITTSKNLDNGTLYPEMKCFTPKDVTYQPSGVRNISECKYNAPALVSYAHFYLADPSYLAAIEGLSPNKEKHESYLSLEPNTGLPLNVDVKIQLNLLMQPIKEITVLSNVSTIAMPAFWFSQNAVLTEDLAGLIKVLLVLPSMLQYTGYGLICLGCLIGLIAGYVTYRKAWSCSESEEEQLIDEQPH